MPTYVTNEIDKSGYLHMQKNLDTLLAVLNFGYFDWFMYVFVGLCEVPQVLSDQTTLIYQI